MTRRVRYTAWDDPGGTTLPWASTDFGWTELVASWSATTPPGSWVEVEVRVQDAAGERSGWHCLGRWQLRVTPHGAGAVHRVGAVVSADAEPSDPETAVGSPASGCREIRLDLPVYAQNAAAGGEAWCSPTSVAMVLAWWLRRAIDPATVAAAVFDPAYGAGNWSFNVAYAASVGMRAFVTRLRGLDEVTAFLTAGIPLVASVTFRRDQLAGAGYDTDGHLLVVSGITGSGDVVCHDPAAHRTADAAQVPVVYDRCQFSACWLEPGRGVVYVIAPPDVAPPPPAAEAAW